MRYFRDLLIALFAIFAALKLTGHFPLSWWWVFAPVILIVAAILIAAAYSFVLSRYLRSYS